jgi:quercetin 2,3-dioxygenase
VQWMTAASGILHKEYHEESFARRGGPFQMAQLWVNLPSEYKMTTPRYQPLLARQMGNVTLPNAAGSVRVVAGQYMGVEGPAQTFTPINVFDAHLRDGGKLALEFPSHQNAALLIMEGTLAVNGVQAERHDLVVFDNVGQHICVEARSAAHLLVLSGDPIDEPVVQYGPFVMNTQREIAQAFTDFQSGEFGHLDD